MIRGVIVTMDQPTFCSLFPMIRIAAAIRVEPHIYESSIAQVETKLQGHPCPSSQMLKAGNDIAKLVERDLFEGVVHANSTTP